MTESAEPEKGEQAEAYEPPRNSFEFMKMSGIERDEGIVVAEFPSKVTGLMASGEDYYYAQWIRIRPVLAELGDMGTRLLDFLPDPVETRIKWWKVRDFARLHGYNLVPELWNGAAMDIPDMYFEDPKAFYGFRLYNAGPWLWPLARPEMVLEEDVDETKLKQVAEEYKL